MTDIRLSRKRLLNQEKKEEFNFIDFLLIFLLVIMIVNILVQTYVLSPVKVDGNSMKLTLNDQDWLFMNKLEKPERGDVVVFAKTSSVNYIKRIIALEGDELYADADGIHLKKNGETEWEIIDDNHAYYYQNPHHSTPDPTHTVIPRIKVAEGEMFVLGDNRNDSADSRTIGTVKIDSILGVVPEWAIKYRSKYSGYLNFVEKVNEGFEKIKKRLSRYE